MTLTDLRKNEAMDFAMSLLANGTLTVDECGRVWRHAISRRGKVVPIKARRAENVGCKGYLRLTLQIPGVGLRSVMAHRVVWVASNGSIPDGLQINHKNLDKQDNRLENLEVVTGCQNIQHSYDNGRTIPWGDSITEWRDGVRRLSVDQKSAIVAMRSSGLLYREISSATGVSVTHVQRICKAALTPSRMMAG